MTGGYLPTILTEDLQKAQKLNQVNDVYKDFYYDEHAHKFTGSVATGVSALKGWIYFALKIARYRYPIYSYLYGSELETLFGQTMLNDDYLLSMVQKYIEDALLINPYIKSVNNVTVERKLEKIIIRCTVKTKYGDVYIEI